MRSFLRVAVPLVFGLGALAWGATLIVNSTAQTWFTRDVQLRATLAANGAQDALASHLRTGERRRLTAALEGLARDERIMFAEVCSPALVGVAKTKAFPEPRLPVLRSSREGSTRVRAPIPYPHETTWSSCACCRRSITAWRACRSA